VLLEGCQKDADVGAVEAREPGMTTIYLSSFLSWATGSLVDWNRPWLWLRLSILDPGDFGASWRSVPISGRAPQLPIAVASGEVTSLVTQTWSSLAVEDCQGQGLFTPTCISCRKSPLVPRTIETMKLSDVLMQYSLPTRRGMIAGKSGRWPPSLSTYPGKADGRVARALLLSHPNTTIH
jgi:hypothetical protein